MAKETENPEVNATDGAKKLAETLGIDLAEADIQGSGDKGRIQAPDVQEYHDNLDRGEDPAGQETEDGETSPHTDNDELNDEEELGNDSPEFDAEESDRLSVRLVPHLDDTGLVILESDNESDEIQEAIDRERDKRDQRVDTEQGEDIIEFVRHMARIRRQPLSRSQVEKRAQRVLTDRGIDWKKRS